MRRKVVPVYILCLMMVVLAAAGSSASTTREKLESFLAGAAEEGFTGIVLVAKGDEILVREGYGKRVPRGEDPVEAVVFAFFVSVSWPWGRASFPARCKNRCRRVPRLRNGQRGALEGNVGRCGSWVAIWSSRDRLWASMLVSVNAWLVLSLLPAMTLRAAC